MGAAFSDDAPPVHNGEGLGCDCQCEKDGKQKMVTKLSATPRHPPPVKNSLSTIQQRTTTSMSSARSSSQAEEENRTQSPAFCFQNDSGAVSQRRLVLIEDGTHVDMTQYSGPSNQDDLSPAQRKTHAQILQEHQQQTGFIMTAGGDMTEIAFAGPVERGKRSPNISSGTNRRRQSLERPKSSPDSHRDRLSPLGSPLSVYESMIFTQRAREVYPPQSKYKIPDKSKAVYAAWTSQVEDSSWLSSSEGEEGSGKKRSIII